LQGVTRPTSHLFLLDLSDPGLLVSEECAKSADSASMSAQMTTQALTQPRPHPLPTRPSLSRSNGDGGAVRGPKQIAKQIAQEIWQIHQCFVLDHLSAAQKLGTNRPTKLTHSLWKLGSQLWGRFSSCLFGDGDALSRGEPGAALVAAGKCGVFGSGSCGPTRGSALQKREGLCHNDP